MFAFTPQQKQDAGSTPDNKFSKILHSAQLRIMVLWAMPDWA